MLAKRIIACLDVHDGKVVKGTRFKNHEVVGNILDLARQYRDDGVDELVFYDISASAEGRRVSKTWISEIAKFLDIPFCVAGGIKTVQDAAEILYAGADKISINSPAIEKPELISELSQEFGLQCVVVGIDSIEVDNGYEVYCYTGREDTIRSARKKTLSWITEVQDLGAGEIVLNCINRDGTGQGYDLEQLKLARTKLTIPLIASGGARSIDDFEKVFKETQVDGALAARAFHNRSLTIPALKQALSDRNIKMNL